MGLREDFAADHPFKSILDGAGVDLIGKGENQKAKCPFHEDKNPSFSVNLSKGSWKCFSGCGEGGVIEFMAKKKGCSEDQIIEAWKESKKAANGSVSIPKQAVAIDWNSCVSRFDEWEQTNLIEQRGYSEKFVSQMIERKMIGVCDGNWSFPIFAGGKVIGTHQKLKNGGWVTRGGSGSPWVIGEHFEQVAIFESQWDAFAFMDKVGWFTANFEANTAVVITRGAQRGKAIQNLFNPTGHIVVWMQNDPLGEDGTSPAEKWKLDILSVLRKAHIAAPPSKYKDLNEWTRDGATGSDLATAWESAQPVRDPRLPPVRSPLDFDKAMKFDPKSDADCLIGNRYLCRGGSSLWVGGSGIGKSVLTLQAAIMFALGESLFGLDPKRSLRSVIVSAEDDFGDISEVIQGVARGLGIKEDSEKYRRIKENVFVHQETVLKGLPFLGYCEELVNEHKADLIWINPLLSYYGGNPNDPEKVSEFTGGISSLQANTKVHSILVHHTGKPKESKTTEGYSVDDFSYIGLGSSVWTNWARAIIVLQGMKSPKDTFVLRLAKRGQRAGVVNEDFEKLREIYLKHGSEGLAWELSDFCPGDEENDQKEGFGRPSKLSWQRVNDAWDGTDKSILSLKEIIMATCKVSDKSAFRAVQKWSGVHIIKNTNDMWIKVK